MWRRLTRIALTRPARRRLHAKAGLPAPTMCSRPPLSHRAATRQRQAFRHRGRPAVQRMFRMDLRNVGHRIQPPVCAPAWRHPTLDRLTFRRPGMEIRRTLVTAAGWHANDLPPAPDAPSADIFEQMNGVFRLMAFSAIVPSLTRGRLWRLTGTIFVTVSYSLVGRAP